LPFLSRHSTESPPGSEPARGVSVLVVLAIALAILIAHAAVFGSWIVDDAGITFAYARNLADGHGLVSQPGLPAVEGYSNPLWTLVVAGFWATGLFFITWTPKLMALLFNTAAFALIARDLAARTHSRLVIGLPLICLAMCSAFVIWTFSGLENALLAGLVAWLVSLTLTSAAPEPAQSVRASLDRQAGFAAALIALTRPEGIAYVIVHPVIAAVAEWRRGPGAIVRILVRGVHVATGFVPVFGAYLVFRLVWFGDWAPNTMRAKEGASLSSLIAPGKLGTLLDGAFGDAGWLMFAALIGSLAVLAYLRRLELRTVVLVSYTALAAALFLVLPNDWMGEFRFGTPFFLLAFWTLGEMVRVWSAPLLLSRRLRQFAAATGMLLAVQMFALFVVRSATFARCPTVPLEIVRATTHGFNTLADRLGHESHSLLVPDLGGELLDSRLRVYDLAGLCDRTIAGALSSAGGTARLHDYLLGEVKPTFIHVSGAFVRLSGLHADPRFDRDYEPLHEAWTGPVTMDERGVRLPWWGDYVRRDVLGNDVSRLNDLRRLHRELGLSSWQVWEAPENRTGWPRSPRAIGALVGWTQGHPIAQGCNRRQ
jgi:hypothetical protein